MVSKDILDASQPGIVIFFLSLLESRAKAINSSVQLRTKRECAHMIEGASRNSIVVRNKGEDNASFQLVVRYP